MVIARKPRAIIHSIKENPFGEDFLIFFMVLSNRDLATSRYRNGLGSTEFVLNLDGLAASQPSTVKENGRIGDAAKGNP